MDVIVTLMSELSLETSSLHQIAPQVSHSAPVGPFSPDQQGDEMRFNLEKAIAL